MATVSTVKGNLYLRAVLPLRDGLPGVKQQRIPLGLHDTPQNQRIAANKLKQLQREIHNDAFNWSNWIDSPEHGMTWRKAIETLYRHRVLEGRTDETIWSGNYWRYLRDVQMSAAVTRKDLSNMVYRFDRSQAAYIRNCDVLGKIAKIAGIEPPTMPDSTYETGAKTMIVPDDNEIEEFVLSAPDRYKWAFGCIATYGLRPHELMRYEDKPTQIIKNRFQVSRFTKTGGSAGRSVPALHPEWVDKFDLLNGQPIPDFSHYDKPSWRVAHWLAYPRRKMKFGFSTRSLRNAYAGRLWSLCGSWLNTYEAARFMGHTELIHSKIYKAFIDQDQLCDRFEQNLLKRR